MRRSRAPSNWPGSFFAARSWAGCTTNMFGFDLRQAQARNVSFVSDLMDAGVEFVACDFPQANRLTIHILSAVAEHEARMISERTRAALAAAKARGKAL